MAIHVDVQTQLDERSVALTARRLEQSFTSLSPRLTQVASSGVTAFRKELDTGVSAAISGAASQFGPLGTVAGSAFKGIATGASGAALGIAAVGVAAVAVGKQFYDLGRTWDSISDNIAIRTGKLGQDLTNLTTVVSDVGQTTAASFSSIAEIVGQLSQAFPNLNVHGQTIRELASNLAFLDAHGQSVNIRELGMAFNAFGISGDQAVRTLDNLQRASQATGIPINELIRSIRAGAPQFQQFGLDLAQATTMLTAFSRAGMDPQIVVTGLRQALKNTREDSRGAAAALADAVIQIRHLHEIGNEPAAEQLAANIFGARNFGPFLKAIEDGTIDVESLKKAIAEVGPSIREMQTATDDWNEEWQKLTNTLEQTFLPAATRVFGFVNDRIHETIISLGWMRQAAVDAWNFVTNPLGGPSPQFPVRPPYQDFGHPPPQGAIPQPVPPTVGGAAQSGISLGNTTGTWWGYQPPETGGGQASTPQVPYPPGYTGSPVEKAQHDVVQAQADLAAAQASGDPNKITAAQNKLTDAQIGLRNAQQGKTGGGGPQVPYPAGYGAPARPGETAEQYGKEQAVYEAVHNRQQAEARLAQVQADSTSTADDLVKAQNDLTKARGEEQQAILRLNESTDKAADNLGDIGVKLDQDFGISRGLPGIAENIVRFVGNLMMAGPLAALGQVAKNAPEGAGGLIGMAAAGGAFGPMFAPPYGNTNGGGGGPGTTTYSNMQNAYNNQMGSAGWPGAPPGYYQGPQPGAGAPTGLNANQTAAYNAMLAAGWGPEQWPALNQILQHESGANPAARNPSSGAFGMYQFLGHENDKYGAMGAYSSDPAAQSRAGMAYIADRYGSPQAAWAFWQGHNWYAQGGAVPIIAHTGEHVLTANDVAAMGGQNAVYNFRAGLHNGDNWLHPQDLPLGKTGQYVPKTDPRYVMQGWQPQFGDAPIFTAQEGGPILDPNAPPPPPPAPPPPPPAPAPLNLVTPSGNPVTPGAAPGPPPVGGVAPWEGFGGGMDVGSGGLIGLAEQAAVTAAGLTPAGPAGAIAAQIGIQEINRAIKFAGAVAGIGVEGLMQTFLPSGGSQLAQNNWLTRIAGGLMGATPQLPNVAGKKTQQSPQTYGNQIGPGQLAQLTPEAVAAAAPPMPPPGQHIGSGAPPGPTIGVNIENFHAAGPDHSVANEVARQQTDAWTIQPGSR